VIVATAGHVDHGKTALVRALTGVDTDRLAEEKARGMSIELGFAYRATRPGGVIGFVDVPGHERLVHTMAAGVAGIGHALLVVAADDGPRPQTLEHLHILELLGIAGLTVAINKIDRADEARIAQVQSWAAARVPAGAVFRVSAARGDGLEALWRHLETLASDSRPPRSGGYFRLPVDRVFSLPGAGLTVTGTIFAGSVRTGDAVTVCPSGIDARVRSLHAQNRATESAQAGERCALNLAGAEADAKALRRGDWIVARELLAPVERFDACLRVLPEAAPLRQGARVHLHLGAKACPARLFRLGDEDDFAQLVPEEPIGALWGDRFVVRDWQARRTLGGGTVLDPFAPARGRSAPGRLAALKLMRADDDAAVLGQLVVAQPNGVDLARFALARNLDRAALEAVLPSLNLVRVGELGVASRHWVALGEGILAALDRWHEDSPESVGPGEAQLRRAAAPASAPEVFAARLAALVSEGRLARSGTRLHQPGHRPVLSPRSLLLWQRIEPLLLEGGVRPPPVGHVAAALGMTPTEVEGFLRQAAEIGLVLAVADNRFYPPQALARLAASARALAAEQADGLFSAAQFRDRTGIGRNVTIKVLEYFDRCGLTRRAGERRRMRRTPEEVFGPAAG
jgi:selenocysteine-specific elongation factor